MLYVCMHVYYKERRWRSVSVNIQYISKQLFGSLFKVPWKH